MSYFRDRRSPSLESISSATSMISSSDKNKPSIAIQDPEPAFGWLHGQREQSFERKEMRSATPFTDDGNLNRGLPPAPADVEGIIYSVHRYFFERDSSVFASQGLSKQEPMALKDVSTRDFDLFLSILYPSSFGVYTACTVDDWSSILQLADRWSFGSIKALAILKLAPIASPIDKIVLGRRHGVLDWLKSAYTAVCLQEAPLNLQEGRRLGVDDVIRINAVRYYHVPDRRAGITPLSDTHIDDAFELVEKTYSAPDEPTAENIVKSGLQDAEMPATVETLADEQAISSADATQGGRDEEEAQERVARENKTFVQQQLADEASAAKEAVLHQDAKEIPGGCGSSGGGGLGAPAAETGGEISKDGGWPADNTDAKDMRVGAFDGPQLSEATSVRDAEAQAPHEATGSGIRTDPLAAKDGGRATTELTLDSGPWNDSSWDSLLLEERMKKQEKEERIEKGKWEKEPANFMAEPEAKLNPGLADLITSNPAPPPVPSSKETEDEACPPPQQGKKKKKKGCKGCEGCKSCGKGGMGTALSTPVKRMPMAYRLAKSSAEKTAKKMFSERSLDNAENYFQQLTPAHHCHFVETLVNTAMQSKAAEDVQLVADLFARAVQKGLCSQASFEEGFMLSFSIPSNIAIEAPKLVDLMAVMMKSIGFDKDARERIACKSAYRYRLLGLLAV
ncbi:hypothetical protein HWV62_29739 [Athelia sp. TMB]|nr:hypothetical protein HWV62_29739 [Athelia sp. TMB]